MDDKTEQLENIVIPTKRHVKENRNSSTSAYQKNRSSSHTAGNSHRTVSSSSNRTNTKKTKSVSGKKKQTGKNRKVKKNIKVITGVLTAINFAFALTFSVLLFNLKMLPGLYFGILCVLLLAMIFGIGFMIFKAHKIQRVLGGVILSLLFDILMGIGIYYINVSTKALKNITTTKTEVAVVDVYVRSDDAAQSITDTAGYTFGILSELDRDNTNEAVKDINKDLGSEITTQEYSGYVDMINALENGEIDAFILNTAYIDVIKDMPDYEDIDTRIRSVAEYKVKHKTQVTEDKAEDTKDKHVFTVYISGIDSREGLIAKSRSDSNILLTVNTETKQILMVNTPRDYYVPLSISGGARDKLTHAGIYGVDVSMATLSMLYNIDVDYYFRINFSGFENIVDALGGVDIYSDVAINTLSGTYVSQGENHMNGEEALAYSRERYSLAGGDNDRGQNQMKVIKAIISKMTSTDFLMNYTSVLDALQGSFETSIPMDLISSIVRDQLANGGDWNVVSYAVTGTGDTQIPWSMGVGAYVMWPNEDTVATATSLMKQVENGEIITQP